MPHGHGAAGENPEEIHVFANSILKDGKPLAEITDVEVLDDRITAAFKSEIPIVQAELCFTRSTGRWQDREWEALPAQLEVAGSQVSASVPADAAVFYLNLFDDRQCVVSRTQNAGEIKTRCEHSAIKIHRELVRMRTAINFIYFVESFMLDPAFNDIRREHVASKQKVVVTFQGIQGGIQ
jgi:hypothetical protein